MIEITRLNGGTFLLNPDLIETIEQTPDTVVKLTTKNYYIVQESPDELVEKIVLYRKRCKNLLYRIVSEN